MNTELWQQIREVFHAAVELPLAERAGFLERNCPDPAMRREVESLLKSHEDAGDLLEIPAVRLSPDNPKSDADDPWIGNSIGPYQVISRIGQGGMGTVYRAMRVDEHYVKQVAIKLVRTGLGNDQYLRRFKNERQIMASLDHPNIARLLDGGTTRGVPYFVMEYIEGRRIDDYCDSLKLNTRERLKLFLQVCSAVQYAHQHLVVHRDLKPGNVLITEEGIPKLLDFGIAKLLDPELFLQTTALTLSQMKPMTPEFASPEQIRGEPVTTSSDVYSLGVVLYRLLTGHSPYKLEGAPIHEVARAISESEPVKPSLVINYVTDETGADGRAVRLTPETVSLTREGQPVSLRHRLEGDLDNILLKALRKETARRYASVERFAEDIQRHLDGLPVLARKDTIRYRTVKFVKRHRVGVAAAVLVAVSLIGGIVTTSWQAHIARVEKAKAQERFNDVRQLANSLIFDVDNAIADLPGATPARKILVTNAARYLDLLSKESRGDAALQRELAAAYDKLGDVQGSQFRGNLGDTPGAMESYRKVVALRETIAASNPRNRDDQFALADSYRTLARMLVLTGDLQSAIQHATKALTLITPIAEAEPANFEVQDKTQNVYELLGDIQGGNGLSANLGNTDAALEYHRRAMEIAQRVLKIKPDDPAAKRSVAIYDIKIGDDLAKQGKRAEAIVAYERALAVYRDISANTTSAIYMREINLVYTRIGDAQLMSGDSRGAYSNYRRSMDLAEQLATADPQNALAREDVATGTAMLGKASADAGNKKEGLAILTKAVGIMEPEVARDPKHTDHKRILALLLVWRGQVLTHTGNPDSALTDYRRAANLTGSIAAADPNDVEARVVLAATQIKIGEALVMKGKVAEGLDVYRKVQPTLETFGMAVPPHPQAQYSLADLYSCIGDAVQKQATAKTTPPGKQLAQLSEAHSWFEKSFAVWKQVQNPGRMGPSGFDTGGPGAVAEKLALCDEAIKKIKS